jgi:hypothetical protein
MKKAKRIVLGEGEIFGHKHILECATDIEFTEPTNGRLEFELKGTGILTHDEHAKMIFDQGSYVSYHQVELNPFTNSIERVYD